MEREEVVEGGVEEVVGYPDVVGGFTYGVAELFVGNRGA